MSLLDIFSLERNKRKLEELKIKYQLNPYYFKEVQAIKLKRYANSYM